MCSLKTTHKLEITVGPAFGPKIENECSVLVSGVIQGHHGPLVYQGKL